MHLDSYLSAIRPRGAVEPIRIQATNCLGQNECQPSRWDELCWRAQNPQLKLRAIVKCAAGTPLAAVRMTANEFAA